jgi:uncharacterized protein (DUF1501 family)
MKRRAFIQQSSLGVIGSMFLPGFLQGMDNYDLVKGFRRLIVIQLSGGNDGLNTVVPIEDDNYYRLRPSIAIKKEESLKINDLLALNPALVGLHELYKEGYVSVINNVGYPNPDRSHFRSMDIWHTAVDSHRYSKTGWLGRYLDSYCDSGHAALEIDKSLSLSLRGELRTGLAVTNSNTLRRTMKNPYFNDLVTASSTADLDEDNQGYLYKTLIQTSQSADYLAETHTVKESPGEFPVTPLGKKLSTVSQFIRSGFDTQVYYVSHNGFDSHVGQRNKQDRLLGQYGSALQSLVQSLEKSGDMENTLIMTFSEFGRRVKENGSRGTDHGKANCLFLIGKDMNKAGVYNTGPNLSALDDGDLTYSIDFRNVYWDIISEWFGKDPSQLISQRFDSLGII